MFFAATTTTDPQLDVDPSHFPNVVPHHVDAVPVTVGVPTAVTPLGTTTLNATSSVSVGEVLVTTNPAVTDVDGAAVAPTTPLTLVATVMVGGGGAVAAWAGIAVAIATVTADTTARRLGLGKDR